MDEIIEHGEYTLKIEKDEYGTTYTIDLDGGQKFEIWFDNTDDNYARMLRDK